MLFKLGHILFLFLFAKSFAVESEPEILDFDYFESFKNDADKVVIDAQSSDPNIQLTAIIELRNLFQQEEYLNEFVEKEHLPVLIKCLNSENTTIQLEAINALSEVAKSSVRNAKEVVREKAVPHFIRLLHSTNTSIAVQSIHTVGSIIFQDAKSRNKILKLGFAEHLIEFTEADAQVAPEILKETARSINYITINNDDYPIPNETIDTLMPALKTLIHHSNPQIVNYITWALNFLTVDSNSKYNINLDKNVMKVMMKLINHPISNIQMAAVGVIRNVVNEINEQNKFVMDNGILKSLPKLLMHENDHAVRTTLLLLTQLFNVSEAQTTCIFDTEIIPLIILHVTRVTEEGVENVAALAATMAAKFANSKQISSMIDMNFVNAMCKFLLKAENIEDIQVILIGYDTIFAKAANRLTELHQKLEKCGGLEAISRLKAHENKDIRRLVLSIIGTYYGKK